MTPNMRAYFRVLDEDHNIIYAELHDENKYYKRGTVTRRIKQLHKKYPEAYEVGCFFLDRDGNPTRSDFFFFAHDVHGNPVLF